MWNVQAVKTRIALNLIKNIVPENCENNKKKQKPQRDKNVLRQNRNFSKRLPYANKKIREIYVSRMNIKLNTIEDIFIKLQSLQGETQLKF